MRTTAPQTTIDDDELTDKAIRVGKAIAEAQWPPDRLKLPKLQEERRLKYNIPNEAYETVAAFDRIFIWQIDPRDIEKKMETDKTANQKANGGIIWLPDSAKTRQKEETPRGVIVSAGLLAMDELRSNGLDVGHIVNFVRLAPWRIPIATYASTPIHLMVMRVGDLVSSEDVGERLRSGEVKIAVEDTEAGLQHVFVDESGNRWVPKSPFVDESY